MPHHLLGVYDAFHSFSEAKRYYKRCRTLKCFILDKDSVKKLDPICGHCGKRISEHSRIANEWASEDSGLRFEESDSAFYANHCWYHPTSKKIVIMQYVCSWQNTLTKVFTLADRLY